jgi:Xaa-Pro dipeptidase
LTRTQNLKTAATKQGKPDAYAIFNPTNITYYTNFPAATALLIPPEGKNILYVSGTNYEQAKAEAQDATVELLRRGENIYEKIAQQVPNVKIGVDTLSFESWRLFSKIIGGADKLESVGSLIREQRAVKDAEEIELIQAACKIADIGIQTAAEFIRPGVKDKEVAAEVEYAMRKAGSDGTAFETIVASGHCCAYPHGTFTEKTIQEGDLIVVDIGATVKFYRSDITRTFAANSPTEKQRRIYEAVKLAHQAAYEKIKPHVLAREVDMAARQVIETAGFGEFFVHNLGHGVGLEVHEAPVLSPDSKDLLEEGNVVTDEPGVYVPGYGGVRIEDTVQITENGAKKLTHAPIGLSAEFPEAK